MWSEPRWLIGRLYRWFVPRRIAESVAIALITGMKYLDFLRAQNVSLGIMLSGSGGAAVDLRSASVVMRQSSGPTAAAAISRIASRNAL